MIDEKLLEVRSYESAGYQPLIDYDKWRVAILRYCDELMPERISTMQQHNETDEVFVLLEGRCICFSERGTMPSCRLTLLIWFRANFTTSSAAYGTATH